MLEHLGKTEAAKTIEVAIEVSLENLGTRTTDLGGTASMLQSEAAILNAI